MKTHTYINSNPAGFDSNCSTCEGKKRDAIHSEPNKAQHSSWSADIAACFHKGNRVSIIRAYNDNGERCVETVAEVLMKDGDQDIADAKLIIRAVNHADKLAEQLRRLRKSIRHAQNCKAPQAFPCSCDADALWESSKTALAAYEAAQ